MTLWIAGVARTGCIASPDFAPTGEKSGLGLPCRSGLAREQGFVNTEPFAGKPAPTAGLISSLLCLFLCLLDQLIIAKQVQHLLPGGHTVLVAKLHQFLAIGGIKHQVTH